MAEKVINLEGRAPTEEEFGSMMVCFKVAQVMSAESVVIMADDGNEIVVRTLIHPENPERIEAIAEAMEDAAKKLREAIPKVTEVFAQIESKEAADNGGLH